MSTTYTPATCAPVEVTTAAQAAELRPGFRVVMAADAHDRARALTERSDPEEGVAAVMGALNATLEALDRQPPGAERGHHLDDPHRPPGAGTLDRARGRRWHRLR